MKNLILCSLVIIISFTFCKKKDKTSEAPSQNTGGGSTTTAGSPPTLSPSTGGDYCSLQTSYQYYDNGVIVVKDSQLVASFYSAPTTSVAPTNIFGGTVTLNGVIIPYSSSGNIYYLNGSLPFSIAGPLTWSVSGSGTVTAFSQAYTPIYPKYTGGNLLPDTCVKANGINITISGVTNNQNSVVLYLYAGSASAFKYILTSNGVISFTPPELSAFPVNQPLMISIYMTNTFSATHGGIKRGFTNYINYQKTSYLK